MDATDETNVPDQGDFLERFLPVQPALYAFVRSFGFKPFDADDVVQEIASALWKSYAAYDPARSFEGWAIGVARNLIRNWFRHRHARRHTVADSALCERIADHVGTVIEERHADFDDRREALEECLRTLPARAVQLMRWRYADRLSLPAIADRIRKTYTAANAMLTRIRASLTDCILARMGKAAT